MADPNIEIFSGNIRDENTVKIVSQFYLILKSGSTDPRCPPNCFPGSQDRRCPQTTTVRPTTQFRCTAGGNMFSCSDGFNIN